MTQLDAFEHSASELIELDEYFHATNTPNTQRPGISISYSFVRPSTCDEVSVPMQSGYNEERYIVQSNPPRNRHVSATLSPYFTGDKCEEVNTQSKFLGQAYKTEEYPSKTLQPVIGDFDDGLKKPYTSELVTANTEKRAELSSDNELRRASSIPGDGSETIDGYLAEFTDDQRQTLQHRTHEIRRGALRHEIDISAVIIGEPYIQRLEGVQSSMARVLAPVLYCYGS